MRGAHRDIWCSKIQHLMEAELFAAIVRTPCTVWPRTVMRGKSRKVNSGHNSVPKPARRTEPSPRNPRFAAHLRCVSAKEGLGSQEGQGNLGFPAPFVSAGRPRHPLPPKAANDHALRGRKVASSGSPLYRRKGSPSAEGYKVKRLPNGSLKSPPGGSAGTAAH